MMIFSRWEVYCGYSLADLAKVRDILSIHKIPYRYKIMNHGGQNRGHSGSAGINHEYERQYSVFVKKQDFEEAQHWIYKEFHK